MKEVYCSDIVNLEGKEVELKGWIDSVRIHGRIGFVDLRDRTGIAQLVFIGDKVDLIKELKAIGISVDANDLL